MTEINFLLPDFDLPWPLAIAENFRASREHPEQSFSHTPTHRSAHIISHFQRFKDLQNFRNNYQPGLFHYVIIGHLIELLTGFLYEQVLDEAMFRPMNITPVFLQHYLTEAYNSKETPAYIWFRDKHEKLDVSKFEEQLLNFAEQFVSSIGVCMSGNDMATWMMYQLLSFEPYAMKPPGTFRRSSLQDTFTRQVPADSNPYGESSWMLPSRGKKYPISHSIDFGGFGWLGGYYRGGLISKN